MLQLFDFLGYKTINYLNALGNFSLFILTALKVLFTRRLKLSKLFLQMERIGINSLLITVITGMFSGAVLVVQSYKGFHTLRSENLIGAILALSMTRELAPVLTGLMVAGRSGSAIAAEIGTMKITEQIDALQTLCINIYQYLFIPRILAGILILPFLCLFSMICGIIGGYLIFVLVFDLNGEMFIAKMRELVELKDIVGGMIKAGVFGFILTAIGSYKGLNTSGGARGVGLATTQSVVISSILIIIANYFLAVIIFAP